MLSLEKLDYASIIRPISLVIAPGISLNTDDEKSVFKLPDDFDEEIPFDLHFDPNKRIKLEISLQNSDGYFNIDNCRVIVQDMKDRPGPRTQPEYITSTTWGCNLPHCGYKESSQTA